MKHLHSQHVPGSGGEHDNPRPARLGERGRRSRAGGDGGGWLEEGREGEEEGEREESHT